MAGTISDINTSAQQIKSNTEHVLSAMSKLSDTAAKITILVVGVFGVFFALFMKGIFDIMLLAFAIYVSGVFVPTMTALYWEKATRKGAIASSVVATIVVILLYALKKPFGIEPIMVSLLVSLILMVVVSLITYKPELATPRLLPKG